MRRYLGILVGGLLAVLAAVPATAQQRENPFLKAKSWAFQLVNLGPAEQAKIAASPFDLVVIDAEHFPDDSKWTGSLLKREEVERMKVKPDGSRRQVIAYFSIGEAEDYRWYWQKEWTAKKPAWIGKESKEWKHNFYVNYWEPTWQDIVLKFSEQVVDAGFDGFYIDRADAYYNFGDTKQARDRMESFVTRLVTHIRAKKPDAAILVQNAEELLDRPAYVAAIDGIAKEDLLYGITHKEEPNKKVDVDWSTNLLKNFQKQGKAIFVIEYLSRRDYVMDAKKRLDDLGFVMYMGPRGLASLNLDAADIKNYAGPRRGPLDPSPENPSAQTVGAKTAAAAAAVGAAAAVAAGKTKTAIKNAADKTKAAFKKAAPAKKAN